MMPERHVQCDVDVRLVTDVLSISDGTQKRPVCKEPSILRQRCEHGSHPREDGEQVASLAIWNRVGWIALPATMLVARGAAPRAIRTTAFELADFCHGCVVTCVVTHGTRFPLL